MCFHLLYINIPVTVNKTSLLIAKKVIKKSGQGSPDHKNKPGDRPLVYTASAR